METFFKKLCAFFKYTVLTLFASACLAFIISYCFSLYWNRPLDNIQSHIIDEYFDGNQLSHDDAVMHKRVKYCTKYVAITQGGSFHPPTSYVSSRSGRYYCSHGFNSITGDGQGGTFCPPKNLGKCSDFCWTLECALRLNDFNWIAKFIKHGGDINAPFGKANSFGEDFVGRTPLHYSASRCRKDLSNFLIESGAKVNIRDATGLTPLYIAVTTRQCLYSNFHRKLALTELLIDNGSDITLTYGDADLFLYDWVFGNIFKKTKLKRLQDQRTKLLGLLRVETDK